MGKTGQFILLLDRVVLTYRRMPSTHQIRLYTKETINAKQPRSAILRAPQSPAPTAKRIEAFGKLRDPRSKVANAERWRESRRIEKRLLQERHGQDIYVYVHIRTGQVAYSLTRVLEEHKILSQLVFHGKKTVPPALRRDDWIPYMSLHFPSSYSGLLAYHKLRELSLQRQLAPPDSLITTREKEKKSWDEGSPSEWDVSPPGKRLEDDRDRLPRLLSQRSRAAKLMFQRKTAVADVAFVVDVLEQGRQLLPPSTVETMLKERRKARLKEVGIKVKKRLLREWRKEDAKAEQTQEAKGLVEHGGTKWGLDQSIARTIAMEHGGIIVKRSITDTKVSLPQNDESQEAAIDPDNDNDKNKDNIQRDSTNTSSSSSSSSSLSAPQVRIFWSDPRDATYARHWPPAVSHGELERLAMYKQIRRRKRAPWQKQVLSDRTVHVIGAGTRIGATASVDQGGEEAYAWMRKKPEGMNMMAEPEAEVESESEAGSGSGSAIEERDRRAGGGSIRSGSRSRRGGSRSRRSGHKGRAKRKTMAQSDSTNETPQHVVFHEPRKGVFAWVKSKLGIRA